MRVDLVLWLLATVAALGGALAMLRAHTGTHSSAQIAGGALGRVSPYAALALLTAGLVWRAWSTQAWPGVRPAEGLAAVGIGALLLTLWLREHPGERAQALALGMVGLVSLAACVAAGLEPLQTAPPLAAAALFGLRTALAGIGSGGWFLVLAGHLAALRRGTTGPQDVPGKDLGELALRASYPWLSVAVAAGSAWSLATYAAFWRSATAELWLVISWLVGAAYLASPRGREQAGARNWLMLVLAALGTVAALLAAWLAPSIL